MKRAVLLAACVALLGASPGLGRELWRRGQASLEVTGSLRTILLGTRGTDLESFADGVLANSGECLSAETFAGCPAFGERGRKDVWQNLTRLRTRFDLRLDANLSAVLTYDNELRFGVLDTLTGGLAEALRRDTFLGLEDDINIWGFRDDSPHRRWRHLLYRAYLQWESEHLEVVVGRQRIAWGVGRLWNPMDRLSAIPPLAIEPDQSAGVDGIDARWLFSGFNYLEAVWVGADPARDRGWALRWHGVAFDTDYSLVFGRLEDARTLGFDLARNLGEAGMGIEVVYTDPAREVWPIGQSEPRELAPYWQVVASVDGSIAVGNGLYVLVEHLYNGNALGFGAGEAGPLLNFFETTDDPAQSLVPELAPVDTTRFVRPASSDVFGASRVITFSRHTTGFALGYDLNPALRVDLITLYDWNGESVIFFPSFRYTPFGSVELTLGAQASIGGSRSEYGDFERLVYLIAEFFF